MERTKIAVYPGTFDPVTLGHLDVIKTSAAIFDEVIIGLLVNPSKKPLFSQAERLAMIAELIDECGLKNVRVIASTCLAIELALSVGAIAIIRGLRLATEYEAELTISFNNHVLSGAIHTVFIAPRQEHIHISSSVVRELMFFGSSDFLNKYVPQTVLERIKRKLKEK